MSGDRLVVVTGASGFIGSNLVSWFDAGGYDVVGAVRHPPEHSRCVPLEPRSDSFVGLMRRGPNVLVHAAGASQIEGSFRDPMDDFRSNTELYLEVLEAVRQTAPSCRVILISSAAVYGNADTQPIVESTPVAPISPYGYHKAMAEQLGLMYHRIFGLQTAAVRVFSAYGRRLRRQVIYDAIRKLRESSPGQPAVFRGTGQESRDFIHVEDVAQGVEVVMKNSRWAGEAYNLASGASTKIVDVVRLIQSQLDAPTAATFDRVTARGHPLNWQVDISSIRSLGFTPSWTLGQGIAEIIRSWPDDHRSGGG
jgi:UDP-glucose 4-epimerase